MKPEAVVFDLGKVLLDFDYSIAIRKLMAGGTGGFMELSRFLLHTPAIVQFETGLISDREFYDAVCQGTGYRGSFEEFSGSFGDIFRPIEPMIRWQESLRERAIPTYVFSNTNSLAVDFIRRTFPFFNGFDGYVLSYEHRSMKPQPRLYEVVEATTGKLGNRLLYLDDRPENIAAGAARGWTTILHSDPGRSLDQARALGL